MDSGKSTVRRFLLTRYSRDRFVNLVSGSSFDVGRRLRFWTDPVEVSRAYDLDGSRVALIDKPGFNDTGAQNDTEILRTIAAFIRAS